MMSFKDYCKLKFTAIDLKEWRFLLQEINLQQKDLGKGLTFIRKEYSENRKRSLFLFDFEYVSDGNYLLAVPATGEEIYFEIYGVDQSGAMVLLVEREL